jgi:hypothetical protein
MSTHCVGPNEHDADGDGEEHPASPYIGVKTVKQARSHNGSHDHGLQRIRSAVGHKLGDVRTYGCKLILRNVVAIRAGRGHTIRVENNEEDDCRLNRCLVLYHGKRNEIQLYLNNAVEHVDKEQLRAEPLSLSSFSVQFGKSHENIVVCKRYELVTLWTSSGYSPTIRSNKPMAMTGAIVKNEFQNSK